MIRQLIKIDEEKCNGCGLCASACHEGAIQMIDKKAKLIRDDYCDGLGNCLPMCPTGAITFENREAPDYDKEAVLDNQRKNNQSALRQWPVQIQLVPVNAPYFHHAHLLVAADCTAFAHGNFHEQFMKQKITLVGCPKLDPVDYSEKLAQIIRENDLKSITVTRMEVPCCGGLEYAVRTALEQSRKTIPLNVITISTEGIILE
ncbi:ATP-binding protein [Anaerostipes sp.]|uniref:ATP-binding protein n=1 Tax=Anaerostipes sp. TaxID=1872530 RepID=UPI0025C40D5E|nr:4Fe-4S binding protein [Anaerostipes sp.]MBS7006971.1 4Fe-4S binding protein [Anaerostipes sp.]